MNRTISSLFLAILPLFFVTLPGTALAASNDLIYFTTTPAMPGPNESVVVKINSFAVNLDASSLTWYINKEAVKQGVGETSLTARTGDFEEPLTIDVLINGLGGTNIRKQFILAPAEVDVLWEAQTYTPPFYKGKALPSYKSLIRLTAIPRYNTTTSNPKDYYYKWTYNRVSGAGEGLGKNSIVIPVGYAGTPVPVNITTSLPGTDWKGDQFTPIPVSNAKILFYEQASLFGTLYHHALEGSASTNGVQFTVHAVPYFFSLDDLQNGNVLYQWSDDSGYRPIGDDPMNFTLKAGDKPGAQSIALTMTNPKRILQSGKAQTSVEFTLPTSN